MHKALYRKWRPQVFDDVCGQEHITSVLKYEVQNGLLSHAYLFCGSRGVGKTTCAKILAKAVNCEHPVNGEPCGKCPACLAIDNGSAVDVVEMDAASNNGVDEIRDLRDEVVFAPAVLKYKVYIVDEVHMLSQSAFNALLKTLEEPPSYVIFILATTEQHKLPATIVSRCQRFEFKRISTDTLAARLNFIAENEKIDIAPDASRLLSRLALGGMRDAISLLELCSGNNEKITVELVNETVGGTGREITLKIAKAVAEKNYDELFSEVNEVVRSSKSLTVFLQNMADFWRDMLVFKTTPDAASYLDLTDFETEQLAAVSSKFTKETLLWHCKLIDEALPKLAYSASTARMTVETLLVRMCDERLDTSSDALLSRISKLEQYVIQNLSAPRPAQPAEPAVEPKIEEKPVKVEKKTVEPPRPEKVAAPEPETARKAVREWPDVVENIKNSFGPSYIAVFYGSKAFIDPDGKVTVVASAQFVERIEKIKDAIAAALSQTLGRAVKVSVEARSENQYNDDLLDELIEETEGQQ